MKTYLSLITVLCAVNIGLSQTMPATEIYMFDISSKKDKVSVSSPVNFTQNPGAYDNQPYFHPDLPIVYFTSGNVQTKTDIKGYNYKEKKSENITQSEFGKFSPTVTPDKQHISCIINRENGAQDLGKYGMDGGEPSIIVDNMTVGYHVWTDNSHLGLFILGKNESPNTLHYLLLPMKRDTVIASNIGRSLHRVPSETAISFVHKLGERDWRIMKFNNHTMKIVEIAPTLTGREDLCWLPDGKILMSDGTGLFFYHPGKSTSWKPVEIAGGSVLKGVTRLASSADGKKLAIVVSE